MNVYDTANKLAQEMKSSKEYLDYKEIKEKVKSNLDLKSKLDEFEKDRYEIQLEAMQGKEQDKTKVENMQKIYMELIQNETTKQYFDAELKFNVLLSDVNKIIGEAVQDVLS